MIRPSLRTLLAAAALSACAVESAPPSPTAACNVAITGVTIVDVDAGTLLPDRTVEVCGSRIGGVRPAGDPARPATARIIDGRGRFLIPGLWDVHVHAFAVNFDQWFAPLMLANGVTAVRDMGFFPDTAHAARRAIAQGSTGGPRMLISMRLDGPENRAPWVTRVRTAAEAVGAVREARDRGMDFVKVYSRLSRDAYLGAASEARRTGMAFDGHVPYSVSIDEAMGAGQRTIEHEDDLMRACAADDASLRRELYRSPPNAPPPAQLALIRAHALAMQRRPDEERCERIAAELARRGVAVTPTLVVYQPYASVRTNLRYPDRERFVSASLRREWNTRLARSTAADTSVAAAYFSFPRTAMWHRSGVPLLAGTDSPLPELVPGFSLHDELALLSRSGLSPLEVLRSATTRPATIFRMRDSLGGIRAGQLADVVLLDANPLESARNLRAIRAVIANGIVHDSAALAGLLAGAERWARP